MPHHLLAFAGSVLNGVTLANIPTVVDSHFTQVNANQYTHPRSKIIQRGYLRAANGSLCRMDSPFLRLVGPPVIQPIQTAAAPSDLPPINKWDGNALTLPALDPFALLVSRAGAGADVVQGFLWMADKLQEEIDRPSYRIQATAAITLTTTGSWVAGAITLPQSLPTGHYRVVGMSAVGTGLIAARLIFPNQPERPGVLAQQADGEFDHEWFSYGNFGIFGEFDSTAPPTLECMGYAAGAAQTVYLDVERTGPVGSGGY